ncbi:MAG: DUF4476 domain-containing protein [Proteobacteria bacterium]|nr:DUF4476 domain-containing protein [Pseudomonadota bacterium]
MKRILCVSFASLLAVFCGACAGMMPQNTSRVVSPVGPMQVAQAPVVQTVTTGPGVAVYGSAGFDQGGNVVVDGQEEGSYNSHMNADGTVDNQMQAGSMTTTSHVSATGATATMVDSETGETITVTAGLPSGMGVPGAAGVVGTVGVGATTTTTISGGEAIYCGMSYESHDALLQSLRANPNDFMGNMDLIKSVAASNYITTEQAVAILYTLGYDIQREEAAGYMYPKMCDPQNWFQIYNTIDSPAVKMDMQEKYGR